MFSVVAAPAKFTVVAVVLSKLKLLESVRIEVDKVGLIDKTLLPEPVPVTGGDGVNCILQFVVDDTYIKVRYVPLMSNIAEVSPSMVAPAPGNTVTL